MKFFGKYQEIRKQLDYVYYDEYSENRQLFQDMIIDKCLENFDIDKIDKLSQSKRLLFTAGPMGAGKTYSVNNLSDKLQLNLSNMIWIDPDKIKEMIPEYISRKEHCDKAASVCHKESVIISDILLELALRYSLDIVCDGTMYNYEWFIEKFKIIRKFYQQYTKIEVLYVWADFSTVVERSKIRGDATGRKISLDVLHKVWENIPISIEKIKPHVDCIYYIDNNTLPRIISTYLNLDQQQT